MIVLWYVNVDHLCTQEVPLVCLAFRHTFLLYQNVGRGFLPSSYKHTHAEVLNFNDFPLADAETTTSASSASVTIKTTVVTSGANSKLWHSGIHPLV